jgi:hypothetical protein
MKCQWHEGECNDLTVVVERLIKGKVVMLEIPFCLKHYDELLSKLQELPCANGE